MDGNPDQSAELRLKLGQVDDTKRRANEREVEWYSGTPATP